MKDLSTNKSIIILLQDKGRGFVIMDIRFDMLNTEQLIKLPNDPTNYIEKKIQRNLRKIKQKLPKDSQQITTLYPRGSSSAKFNDEAKLHKLSTHDTVDNLPLRPIISKVNTAT